MASSKWQVAILVTMLATVCHAGDNEGWVDLFNGKDLSGWQTRSGDVPTNWVVEDGCLHRAGRGGDIVTVKEYEDFELTFEWKISARGNSGVKYRVRGKYGPEYQVLDDQGHSNGGNPFTSAAAMYLMARPNADKVLKPVGEFNVSRIVAKGNHLEHWLNSKKVLELDVGSDEWNTRQRRSKFKNVKDYGRGVGRILLQDHNDPVWFRAIRIRAL